MPSDHFGEEDGQDGVLDMRYNCELEAELASAGDILNNASSFELA
jgi:hypothetical protein